MKSSTNGPYVVGLDTKITPDISLVMIVAPYESASSIARALTSVKGVVNEAVLYWTGEPPEETLVKLGAIPGKAVYKSKDGCPHPLKGAERPVISEDQIWRFSSSFKVKAIKGYWDDDFSRARNEAMSHATGEWIMVLDADEAFEKMDTAKLHYALRSHGPNIYAPTICSHLGEAGQLDHMTARIFPNKPNFQYRNLIHEQPVDINEQVGCVGLSGVHIHHYGYTSDAHKETGKQQRNQRLLGKQIQAEPHNPIWRLYLGQSLKQDGHGLLAADQYRVCMTLCRQYQGTDLIYEQAATELVSGLGDAGLFQFAISDAMLALRHKFIRHPGFWLTLGNAQNQHGLYQDAISSLERCIACRDAHTQQSDAGVLTWKPHTLLIGAKWELGRKEEARAHFEQAKSLGMPESYREICEEQMSEPVAA